MLATYFDESCDKNNRILVVCGLFARGTDIAKLERGWAARIDKTNAWLISKGRKPISRYHATELNARDNEFEGWSKKESIQFSKYLLRLIRHRQLYSIAHAVVLKDLVDVWPDTAGDPKGYAYQHAMMDCLIKIGNEFGIHIPKAVRATRGISIVFDRSKEFRDRASTAFCKVRDDPSIDYGECFNSIAEGNSLSHIALQAADLLAYEIMRETARKLFSSSIDMRKFFKKMVGGNKVQIYATYSDKRYFNDLREAHIKKLKLSDLTP